MADRHRPKPDRHRTDNHQGAQSKHTKQGEGSLCLAVVIELLVRRLVTKRLASSQYADGTEKDEGGQAYTKRRKNKTGLGTGGGDCVGPAQKEPPPQFCADEKGEENADPWNSAGARKAPRYQAPVEEPGEEGSEHNRHRRCQHQQPVDARRFWVRLEIDRKCEAERRKEMCADPNQTGTPENITLVVRRPVKMPGKAKPCRQPVVQRPVDEGGGEKWSLVIIVRIHQADAKLPPLIIDEEDEAGDGDHKNGEPHRSDSHEQGSGTPRDGGREPDHNERGVDFGRHKAQLGERRPSQYVEIRSDRERDAQAKKQGRPVQRRSKEPEEATVAFVRIWSGPQQHRLKHQPQKNCFVSKCNEKPF